MYSGQRRNVELGGSARRANDVLTTWRRRNRAAGILHRDNDDSVRVLLEHVDDE
jgi:hypothetical protein